MKFIHKVFTVMAGLLLGLGIGWFLIENSHAHPDQDIPEKRFFTETLSTVSGDVHVITYSTGGITYKIFRTVNGLSVVNHSRETIQTELARREMLKDSRRH